MSQFENWNLTEILNQKYKQCMYCDDIPVQSVCPYFCHNIHNVSPLLGPVSLGELKLQQIKSHAFVLILFSNSLMFNGFNKCVHIINLDKHGNVPFLFQLVCRGFGKQENFVIHFFKGTMGFQGITITARDVSLINGNVGEISIEFI